MTNIQSFLITGFFCGLSAWAFSQNNNPHYDSTLVAQYGADDYGMKSYVLVMLKTGDNPRRDPQYLDSCYTGHFSNINKLIADKKMIVAGPIGENTERYRGIFILDVKTVEEAQKLLENDPTVQEGIFDVDLLPWYGPAALPAFLEVSDKLWKIKP